MNLYTCTCGAFRDRKSAFPITRWDGVTHRLDGPCFHAVYGDLPAGDEVAAIGSGPR